MSVPDLPTEDARTTSMRPNGFADYNPVVLRVLYMDPQQRKRIRFEGKTIRFATEVPYQKSIPQARFWDPVSEILWVPVYHHPVVCRHAHVLLIHSINPLQQQLRLIGEYLYNWMSWPQVNDHQLSCKLEYINCSNNCAIDVKLLVEPLNVVHALQAEFRNHVHDVTVTHRGRQDSVGDCLRLII